MDNIPTSLYELLSLHELDELALVEPAGMLHPGVVLLLPFLQTAVTVEALDLVRQTDVEQSGRRHLLLLLAEAGGPVLEGGQSGGLGGEVSVYRTVVRLCSLSTRSRTVQVPGLLSVWW